MGMGVVRGKREKGRKDPVVRERERSRRRGVDGWARPRRRRHWVGLGSARWRRRGCVCVNVRGRVRHREK